MVRVQSTLSNQHNNNNNKDNPPTKSPESAACHSTSGRVRNGEMKVQVSPSKWPECPWPKTICLPTALPGCVHQPSAPRVQLTPSETRVPSPRTGMRCPSFSFTQRLSAIFIHSPGWAHSVLPHQVASVTLSVCPHLTASVKPAQNLLLVKLNSQPKKNF